MFYFNLNLFLHACDVGLQMKVFRQIDILDGQLKDLFFFETF